MAHDALRSRCVARRWPLEAEGLGPGSGAPRGWDAPEHSVRVPLPGNNEVHAEDGEYPCSEHVRAVALSVRAEDS